MKTLIFLHFFLLVMVSCAQNKFVYLGEYDEKHLSIRVDGDGEIYPDYNVPIDSGCNDGPFDRSFVEYLYDKDCPVRPLILKNFSLDEAMEFKDIQREMVKRKIEQINAELEKLKIDNIIFIMVGFNNHYTTKSCTDCSNFKLHSLKDTINAYLAKRGKQSLVVEFYWDHTETECQGIQTALNLSNSCVNSTWAGLALREIVNGLNCKKIQMISHSMGANIITETIFNQTSKFGSKFNNELYPFRKVISIPNKTFSVGLVAPAIPGVSTFVDYFKIDSSRRPNAKFVIGFNRNDKALLKQFIGGAKFPNHFSSTSLGCKEDEVDSVIKLFKDNEIPKKLIKIDFSLNDTTKQEEHGLEHYMKQPQYKVLLDEVFN